MMTMPQMRMRQLQRRVITIKLKNLLECVILKTVWFGLVCSITVQSTLLGSCQGSERFISDYYATEENETIITDLISDRKKKYPEMT